MPPDKEVIDMDLNDLKIDPEFAEKIPPLTDEEYAQLEANILAEGTLLNPLIIWNGVIVDGHNRYRILQEHPEITFEVREKEFENRFDAVAWICRNQLGRRNLTEIQKRILIGKQYEAEKASHGHVAEFQMKRDENGRFTVTGQNDQNGESETTRQRIARENGVSDSYVRHAETFSKGIEAADEVVPGIKQEILAGTVKPTIKAVEAVARASPEDRRELAEQLRKPRASPKKREPVKSKVPGFDKTEDLEDEPEDSTSIFKPALASAQAISDGMASSPDRKNRNTPVEIIVAELADAIDSMIFRWDFCFSVNQPNVSLEECQKQVRILASKGIKYLKSYQGGNENDIQ